jgi:hypothetical protein
VRDEVVALWLEFELFSDRDPECDTSGMEITLASGKRYRLSVWTFGYLQVFVTGCREEGEPYLGGLYMVPPDLLVERMDRATIERVVNNLILEDELEAEWEVHGAEECAGHGHDWDDPGAIIEAGPIDVPPLERHYSVVSFSQSCRRCGETRSAAGDPGGAEAQAAIAEARAEDEETWGRTDG